MCTSQLPEILPRYTQVQSLPLDLVAAVSLPPGSRVGCEDVSGSWRALFSLVVMAPSC